MTVMFMNPSCRSSSFILKIVARIESWYLEASWLKFDMVTRGMGTEIFSLHAGHSHAHGRVQLPQVNKKVSWKVCLH